MKPAVTLKQKLVDSELVVGIIITNHLWLELIEIALHAGLDYVIIDAEHNTHHGPLIADACRLGRLAEFPVLLRPQRTDTESIGLAMDLGPCGLLLPMIETPDQLDRVRDGIYLPPRGKRRPGGPGNRWVTEFNDRAYRTQVEDHLVVLPQIESQTGIENAQAIAGHEITTALAVGPFDLSARLGVCGIANHPKLQQALQMIRLAADQANKPMWMIGNGEDLVRQGYRFICVAEPSFLLEATLKNTVTGLRQQDAKGA